MRYNKVTEPGNGFVEGGKTMAARVTDRNDWFDIWFEDKKAMVNTMARNMAADLTAGYDYFGKSIQSQKAMIESYQEQFDKEMDTFKYMEDKEVNRWCYYDMKKRGVIE